MRFDVAAAAAHAVAPHECVVHHEQQAVQHVAMREAFEMIDIEKKKRDQRFQIFSVPRSGDVILTETDIAPRDQSFDHAPIADVKLRGRPRLLARDRPGIAVRPDKNNRAKFGTPKSRQPAILDQRFRNKTHSIAHHVGPTKGPRVVQILPAAVTGGTAFGVYAVFHFPLTLLVAFGMMTALWLPSLPLRDVSIIDILWAPAFAILAGVCLARDPMPGPRAWIALALVSLWAVRLGLHVLLRWIRLGHEDYRYAEMRRARGTSFPLVSLVTIFWLQAVLLWIISWPLQVVFVAPETPLNMFDPLAIAMIVAGIVIEGVADAQLTRFRANPGNKGQVMRTGLWSWSRPSQLFRRFSAVVGILCFGACRRRTMVDGPWPDCDERVADSLFGCRLDGRYDRQPPSRLCRLCTPHERVHSSPAKSRELGRRR